MISPTVFQDFVDQNPEDITLKSYEVRKQKECPRCDGSNIFVIDKEKKSYWCKDCCCGFGKRRPEY